VSSRELCCRCGKNHATHEVSIGPLGSGGVAIYRVCETCSSFVGAAVRGDPLFSRGEQGREPSGVALELLEGLEQTRDD